MSALSEAAVSGTAQPSIAALPMERACWKRQLPFHLILAAALLPVLLAACSGSLGSNQAPATLSEGSSNAATSEDFRLGTGHFNRGEYGLAEQYFRQATDKAPQDAASWIGLAATYDQLRRFDLADRAYRTAIKLSGETAQILNNQGYSYMLRGNLAAARANFTRARALDPDNPTLINNMKLLEGSTKYMKANPL